MKRRIGIVLLGVLILLVSVASPVSSAPPEYEEWGYASFANGLVIASYIINTTNLKTTQFNVINDSDEPIYLYVTVNGEIDWDFLVAAQTTSSKAYVVNFKRLPQTDPDDPGSIRYPNNTYFFARYPAY